MHANPALDSPLVAMRDVSKTFQGEKALDGVDLAMYRGRVEALIGHNGSGKSTLIKILSGFHACDEGGVVEVDGRQLKEADPVASAKAGLRFIHQDLGLLDQLTVLENLRLGGARYASRSTGPIRWRQEHRRAQQLLDEFEIDVRSNAPMSSASPVQRTGVAVARAMQDRDEVRLLVLDEPTATLPDREVEKLFRTVRTAVAAGVSVLYVSHRLEELYAIADHITVLRDGGVVGTGTPDALSTPDLVALITGSDAAVARGEPHAFRSSGSRIERPEIVLRLRDVDGGQLSSLSVDVGRGEVVGVAGLAGSGVHDIPELLLGRVPLRGGTVEVNGAVVNRLDPRAAKSAGLAILPSARALKSIATMNVRENITLPAVSEFSRRGVLRKRDERAEVGRLLRQYAVRPLDTERRFATLSGGNQQKACVAKWMRTTPRVLVLDEPTAGVDVGGRQEILRLVREAADQGLGVLVCSSDLDDLAEICDRVVVVRKGTDATRLKGKEITRDAITAQCYQD